MNQKKMTPERWEQLFKKMRMPNEPDKSDWPVHYFDSYTNANIREARRLEKQGIHCLFPDPRGPAYMSSEEREARRRQREEGC